MVSPALCERLPRDSPSFLGPVGATPPRVVDLLLSSVALRRCDTLVDVGCGDGRVVLAAAARTPCTALGVELDAAAAGRAAAAVDAAVAERPELAGRVRILHADALSVSLRPATVVFLYLLPSGNAVIAAKLEEELAPGARVVSYMFRLPAEPWAGRLVATHAVAQCRPGGVDTSAFTKLFVYER